MRLVLLVFMLTWHLIARVDAGMVFTVRPADGFETIPSGSAGQFQLFIRSNTLGGEQVNSLDVNVVAGAGNGTAGVFTSGTTTLLSSVSFDVSSTRGQAFSTNFQNSGTLIPFATGVGSDLGIQYGALTLSTSGVTPGTYAITLNQLNANPFFSGVGSPPPPIPTFAVNGSFTVIAVPEPASTCLFACGAVAVLVCRRRRCGWCSNRVFLNARRN